MRLKGNMIILHMDSMLQRRFIKKPPRKEMGSSAGEAREEACTPRDVERVKISQWE